MRRARLQIKPNLGPRPTAGARSQPSADAAPSRAKPVVSSASQPTIAAHDVRQDQYTALKATESKSDSSLSSDPKQVHSDLSVSSRGGATSSLVGESVSENAAPAEYSRSGAVTRSPRKSVGTERKSVGIERTAAQKDDKSATESVEHVSPRRAVTVSPVRPRSARATSSLAASSTDSPPTNKQPKSHQRNTPTPQKGPLPGGEKLQKARLPRSHFGKVRPNLVDSGRNKNRSSDTNKEQQVTEPGVRGRDEEASQSENAAAGDSSTKDHVAAEADSSQSTHGAGETKQPGPSSALPAVRVTPAAEDERDVSDVTSEISTPAFSEGMDETLESASGESEQPLKPDEKKKQAADRKTRRPKGSLPSSDAPVDRSSMKMVDLIYWNPSRNRMTKKEPRLPKQSASGTSLETPSSDSVDGDASNMSDSLPVPQVKIGPDGNIILNIDSLVVENKAGDSMEENVVEEDEDRFFTCSSFRENKKGKFWTKNETNRFFRALQLVGTDFSLMCSLFPSRSRKELKNKFRKEEKNNRHLVDKALKERENFDRSTFELAKVEDEAEARRRKNKMEKLKRKKKQAQGSDEDFPGYETKRKRREPASMRAREVVDILVNMSRGKVPSKDGSGDDNDEDSVSETSSIVSEQSSVAEAEDRPFVPRFGRQRTGRSRNIPKSSSNVIIDSQVPVPTDPELSHTDTAATTVPAATRVTETVVYVPCGQQTRVPTGTAASGAKQSPVLAQPAGGASAAVSSSLHTQNNVQGPDIPENHHVATVSPSKTLVTNAESTRSGVTTLPGENLVPSSVQTVSSIAETTVASPRQTVNQRLLAEAGARGLTIPPNVLATIEQLQTQSNNSVDVVLVEDQAAGQSVVHVYVVPRAATESAVLPVQDQVEGRS
ncbi:hypothetical protein BaRGS_00018678 [Batillaria attramentaria]|uniref:Myb-like domain-containing protein n=1 Tax=Batillaria attramentaria TaxID=370345 RepID=A0ABD0KSV8_9CAEN